MNTIDISGLKYNAGGNSDIINLLGRENYRSELSEDYIIPDYISDVKKVLHTFARPKMKSRYINGNKLIYDGEVIFTVLLLTEDGTVKSVTLSSLYNNTAEPKYLADQNGLGNNYLLSVSPDIESIDCRLLNPRKINVRATLSTNVGISRREPIVSKISGLKKPDDETGIERKIKSVASLNMAQVFSDEFNLSEDIEIEASLPPVKEILYAGADIAINEYRHVQDKINASGEATVLIIYNSDSDDIIAIIKKIPVNVSLEAEKIDPDCEFFGITPVGTVKTNIENNSYGESRIIELDVTYNIDLLCVSNETAEIMQDIYSVDYQCENNYRDIDICYLKRCMNTNFTVNAVKDRREAGAENAKEIIMTFVSAKIDNLNRNEESGKLTAEGNAEVSHLLRSGDENEISHVKYNFPLKFETDIMNVSENFEFETHATAANVRGRLDSNNIYCDFELLLGLMLIDHTQERMVDSTIFNTSQPVARTDKSTIVLYYPQSGEQLWDIAKYYNTTCDAIAMANNLKDEKISDQKVLIIPRYKNKVLLSKII